MFGTALSPLRLMAWGAIALGGLVLISLFVRIARSVGRRFRPLNVWARYAEESSPFRRRQGPGLAWLMGILLFLLVLLLFGVGWILFSVEELEQLYASFPEDQVAGRVQCLLANQSAGDMMSCSLVLNSPVYSQTVSLQGVRWGLEGEILVWDPAWERFGLRSGYRLIRLVAYDAAGRVAGETLIPSSEGRLQQIIFQLGESLPFVRTRRDMVSGNVATDEFYELTVSRAGFFLREWGPLQP